MDIVERLRGLAGTYDEAGMHEAAELEAADEIERLRHDIDRHVQIAADLATENEQLRAALQVIVDRRSPYGPFALEGRGVDACYYEDVARNALNPRTSPATSS